MKMEVFSLPWFLFRGFAIGICFFSFWYEHRFEKEEGKDERGERIKAKASQLAVHVILFSILGIVIGNDTFQFIPNEEWWREIFFSVFWGYYLMLILGISFYKKKI